MLDDVVAVEAEAVGQHEPALDAAGVVARAVVLEHAMDPVAAQLAVVDAADEGGVLARDGGLIAVAVERPGRDLALVQLAAVQELMERVLVVIALGADGLDRGLELLGAPKCGVSGACPCAARS